MSSGIICIPASRSIHPSLVFYLNFCGDFQPRFTEDFPTNSFKQEWPSLWHNQLFHHRHLPYCWLYSHSSDPIDTRFQRSPNLLGLTSLIIAWSSYTREHPPQFANIDSMPLTPAWNKDHRLDLGHLILYESQKKLSLCTDSLRWSCEKTLFIISSSPFGSLDQGGKGTGRAVEEPA